jgi:5-methyltetrahydrofolate--homocysteine methyltransferase
LIKAVREHKPDMLGLSCLLVKSAQQMVVTAEDLKNAGIHLPILVGGAALSEKFTASKIAPAYQDAVLYAKDAMTGLDLANRLVDVDERQKLLKKNEEIHTRLRSAQSAAPAAAPAGNGVSKVNRVYEPPAPPDLKLHVLNDFRVEDIFKYVNPVMLYGKHLGLRGRLENLLAQKNEKAVKLHADITALQDEIIAKRLIQPKAVFKFFAAQSDGNKLHIYDSPTTKKPLVSFDFPRQPGGDNLSLSDYVLPAASGKMDYVSFFVVTCGHDIMARANKYREEGEYFKSHALSVIAIESAEAFAELLHEKLRAMWGFPDPAGLSFSEKFQAKYRGLRVSFGYPACPNLEDQTQLFQLLEPQKHVGVFLTENFMMEPEATVSALVFHHPEAHYFSVAPTQEPVL